jgi:transcriptional regulator with XRE-family HTH domain
LQPPDEAKGFPMITTDPKTINEHAGRIVKWLREVYKLDQSALAARIATSQSSLSQIEAGRRRLSPEVIAKIAQSLEIDPAYLMTLTIPESSLPEGPIRQKLLKLQDGIRTALINKAKVVNVKREKIRLKELA